ncbi:hypothetical protein PSECIP111951_03482 [Pseudoalteromonas holothuriae]|uniref:Uncharacterized protein n=1 Tax=Pseudoalteromonas holothuriae TaxID=2963714 RepID=A0A9W4QZJ4_9GAMM|nr:MULTISPECIES: hypothetical protein [unclassified Pseudoalteromonas]CAH9060357.1 hypothetical protein PSECIP111854_02589 [Pseudoalteromonas sp. CIP111854]CAH9066005.1 hypothetical protein PSECIP111951_03482 [Pseudoalteromonas sp. CIP111951]
MKTLSLTAATALLLVGASSAQARMNCDVGGYWDIQTRNVQVCDTETENYTVTKRHCGYNGHLTLGHLWNQPDFYLPHIRYASTSRVLAETSSCPSSQWDSQTGTYWYTKPNGTKSTDWYTYSGLLGLSSDQLKTTQHTRTVQTNCRTETRTVRVWRCGYEP